MNVKVFVSDFFKTRKITYYIVLGFAVIALINGIIATAGLSQAGANALPFALTLIGLVAFLILSPIGQEKFGAGFAAFASFGALVATVCQVFEYFIAEIQGQAMTGFDIAAVKGMSLFIACTVIFVICSVAMGVLAWLKLSKPYAAAGTDVKKQESKNES